MIVKFKKCCLENSIIMIMASIMAYLSDKIYLHNDPIILVGYFVVYLELSKLLYKVIVGIDTPIMLRYVMASIAVGSAIKVYEAMIEHNTNMMFAYSGITLIFLTARFIAIKTTEHGR